MTDSEGDVFPKTQAELWIELDEQLAELRASCAAYDAGSLWEAKRLAASVYKLVQDSGKRTKSILNILDLKEALWFISTRRALPTEDQIGVGNALLTLIGFYEEGICYVAPLARAEEDTVLAFEEWWNEVIYFDGQRRISRAQLVWTMGNQDGGRHVDDHITSADYVKFRDKADDMTLGWNMPDGSYVEDGPLKGAHRASMRQIAWELDRSLAIAGY